MGEKALEGRDASGGRNKTRQRSSTNYRWQQRGRKRGQLEPIDKRGSGGDIVLAASRRADSVILVGSRLVGAGCTEGRVQCSPVCCKSSEAAVATEPHSMRVLT